MQQCAVDSPAVVDATKGLKKYRNWNTLQADSKDAKGKQGGSFFPTVNVCGEKDGRIQRIPRQKS